MTTHDKQSLSALLVAIHAAQASQREEIGLSANRSKTENGYEWDIFIGVADPGAMTIIDSENSYTDKSVDEIAAAILYCWDESWDD